MEGGGSREKCQSRALLEQAFCPVERYGAGARSAWRIDNLQLDADKTSWTSWTGSSVANLEFPLAGEYNVWNATAAAAMAAAYGISKMKLRLRSNVQERKTALGSESTSERHHRH